MTVGTPASDRELVLTGFIDTPREKLFRAWTEPELLKQRFAPAPYTTPVAELDVRPSGANLIVMRDPEGNEFPNRGIYLEVIENERRVFPMRTQRPGRREVSAGSWLVAGREPNHVYPLQYSEINISPVGGNRDLNRWS
jgi:uncharacterized protein YndB with AHSA1/START domain